jgi:hypothetical protein
MGYITLDRKITTNHEHKNVARKQPTTILLYPIIHWSDPRNPRRRSEKKLVSCQGLENSPVEEEEKILATVP